MREAATRRRRHKMPDWVQTGFTEYLRHFPKDMPFELVEIPASKNADIKRILDK